MGPDSSLTHTGPLISVIVPVYNQQRRIKRCLASIIGQTYKNLEIIVVNDGSTDNSMGIIGRLAARDNRIKVLDQDNSGVAAARKNGYLQCAGEWCVFVDSDDYLLPDSIETLHSAAQEYNADITSGGVIRRIGPFVSKKASSGESQPYKVIRQPDLFSSYYVSFFGVNILPVTMYGKIIRKAIIDQALNHIDVFTTPPLHMGEDEAFNLLLFPYVQSYLCLADPVYVYRFGGLTSGYNRYVSELLDFSDFRIGLLDRYNYDKGYSPLFIEYVNILITQVKQGMESGTWNPCEAKEWLEKELESRCLMQRMRDYFKDHTDIPDKCRMALDRDVAGIVCLAESQLKKHRLRSLVKRMLK